MYVVKIVEDTHMHQILHMVPMGMVSPSGNDINIAFSFQQRDYYYSAMLLLCSRVNGIHVDGKLCAQKIFALKNLFF